MATKRNFKSKKGNDDKKFNPYQKFGEEMAERIVNNLEAGNLSLPWSRPWSVEGLEQMSSYGKAYKYRVNQMWLGYLSQLNGYKSRVWFTATQLKKLAEKDGQTFNFSGMSGKSAIVMMFFPKKYTRKVKENGVEVEKEFSYVKASGIRVWNADDIPNIENYPSIVKHAEKFTMGDDVKRPVQNHQAFEQMVAAYVDSADGPSLQFGTSQAFYRPSSHSVHMPPQENFDSDGHYMSTLGHELAHSTGSVNQLKREGITDPIKFGNHKYGTEELVAEFATHMVLGSMGISYGGVNELTEAYLTGWAQSIKANPDIVWKAMRQAEKATELLLGFLPADYDFASDDEIEEIEADEKASEPSEAVNDGDGVLVVGGNALLASGLTSSGNPALVRIDSMTKATANVTLQQQAKVNGKRKLVGASYRAKLVDLTPA